MGWYTLCFPLTRPSIFFASCNLIKIFCAALLVTLLCRFAEISVALPSRVSLLPPSISQQSQDSQSTVGCKYASVSKSISIYIVSEG